MFCYPFVEFVEFFSSLVTSSSAWTLQGFSRTRLPACALQGRGLPKSFPSSKSLLMKRGKLVESKDEQSKPSWRNKRIFYTIVQKKIGGNGMLLNKLVFQYSYKFSCCVPLFWCLGRWNSRRSRSWPCHCWKSRQHLGSSFNEWSLKFRCSQFK